MKKIWGKVGLSIFTVVLCFAGVIVARQEMWALLGIGWVSYFAQFAIILVLTLTLGMIWMRRKDDSPSPP